MRNLCVGLGLLLLFVGGALAAPNTQNYGALLRSARNAQFVYVTSYDGDQFSINPLPEDHRAIANVQNAIQGWGRFTVVDQPEKADIVIMVQSRSSEDVLAVYDAHGWPGNNFLWREMGQNGLQQNEAPLLTDLRTAFEKTMQ